MRKAICMYSLFVFGYLGFATIPVTEVSAQTIRISSEIISQPLEVKGSHIR